MAIELNCGHKVFPQRQAICNKLKEASVSLNMSRRLVSERNPLLLFESKYIILVHKGTRKMGVGSDIQEVKIQMIQSCIIKSTNLEIS